VHGQVGCPTAHLDPVADLDPGQRPLQEKVPALVEPEALKVDNRGR
jgi:hypothetical protein